MNSIYSVTDFLEMTAYKNKTVVNVFKKINIPTIYIGIEYYDEYIIKEYDRWDRLANKFYGTPHLWWLIASFNKILDPFISLIPGTKINIIKPAIVPNLLMQMKGYI